MRAVDVIVVGAGSAGAAMAARLSEDADRSVLLLESGPDYRSAETPSGIRSLDPRNAHPESLTPLGSVESPFEYSNLKVRRTSVQPRRGMRRGRGSGGSSSINGLFHVRPSAEDLDGWAETGASGWSFQDTLPFMNRLESDCDFGEKAFHGSRGPVPVTRPTEDELLPVDEAFRASVLSVGHQWSPDHNEPRTFGLSPYAYNAFAGMRVSSNDAYLEPARERPNLTIFGGTTVESVTIERGRVVGVRALKDGGSVTYFASHVVLCAGAVHSPAILLRSGVGPADELSDVGAEVVEDLPVGHGVQDHPLVSVRLRTDPQGQVADSRHARLVLRYGLGLTSEPVDGMISLSSYAAEPGVCTLIGWLNRVESRGRVRIASLDPFAPPVIDSNLASDGQDLTRMLRLTADMIGLSQEPGLRSAVAAPQLWSAASEIGFSVDRKTSITDIERFVIENLSDGSHICGSVRMGSPSDPRSVVDPSGHVLGIDGLSVADASIFPWVPCANTNLAAVLVAEKIAEGLREDSTGVDTSAI